MSYKLQDTAACKMRDQLLALRNTKKITPEQISDRLYKIDLPEWLQHQILNMVNHNQYKRLTCPIELAMEAAVHRKILDRIMAA